MESDVSRSIEEQLSAFLDGELRDEELELLVRRLERDKHYRATLARYSLIGNVVRKDPVQTYPERFRAGIMAAIGADSGQGVPAEKYSASGTAWRVPVASVASVAAVLLLVLGLSSEGLVDKLAGSGSVASAPQEIALESSVVSKPTAEPPSTNTGTNRHASLNPERLNSYMVSHREYSQPLHGSIANSRIVVQQARFEE
jgi:negative regulator of sigma E activity